MRTRQRSRDDARYMCRSNSCKAVVCHKCQQAEKKAVKTVMHSYPFFTEWIEYKYSNVEYSTHLNWYSVVALVYLLLCQNWNVSAVEVGSTPATSSQHSRSRTLLLGRRRRLPRNSRVKRVEIAECVARSPRCVIAFIRLAWKSITALHPPTCDTAKQNPSTV